jgi:hypothetical protein
MRMIGFFTDKLRIEAEPRSRSQVVTTDGQIVGPRDDLLLKVGHGRLGRGVRIQCQKSAIG